MKNITCYDSSLVLLCKEHLDELAGSLRVSDCRELWAMYRQPMREGLEICRSRSVYACTFIHNGRAAACAGLAPESLLGRGACVWSWTGREAARCPKAFWRASRAAVAYFQTLYPQLYAVCDARYAMARRYLQRLGACRTGESVALAGPETVFWIYRFNSPVRVKIN